jgi:hypothetical protein
MNFHDLAFSLERFLKCPFNYFILKANRFLYSAVSSCKRANKLTIERLSSRKASWLPKN